MIDVSLHDLHIEGSSTYARINRSEQDERTRYNSAKANMTLPGRMEYRDMLDDVWLPRMTRVWK